MNSGLEAEAAMAFIRKRFFYFDPSAIM